MISKINMGKIQFISNFFFNLNEASNWWKWRKPYSEKNLGPELFPPPLLKQLNQLVIVSIIKGHLR